MAHEIKREATNSIPDEIIEEILYNLPVKSLLRFKCVSERWRSVISSKEFIKEHLKKSSTNPDYTHHKLVSKFHHRYLHGERIFLCDLRPLLYGSTTVMEGWITRQDRRSLVFIWGSCNGLILMTFNTTDIYLFNLATKESKKNVSFQPKGEPGRLSDHFVYGLGYDESADEYKVVCIYNILDSKPYQTQIYSSKTLSWKKIEDFDNGFPVDDSGKFVNGKLHWLAAQDGGDDHDIVSLDLVEEKYGVVAQPENFSTPAHYKPMLGDLGGYLSLISYAPRLDTNVWVMMEYGVRESWTKIWSLSDFDVPKNHYRGAMPIFFKKNGDITVALGSSIVVCNGKKKMYACQSAVIDDINDAIVYVGSLVSPFGDVENHLRRMGPEL